MDPTPNRLIEIFSQAQAKASPAERERYLAEACQGQPELRKQIEALLGACDRAGDFLAETVKLQPPDVVTEGPGAVVGRYKLLQQIGEGGCGVVYMAEQEKPIRRRVAFKVIKLGMDTKQVIARFEAERQALALMDHPNIAKVLDAGTTETGRPYFVMELVRGIRITDYCDHNNLSTEQRLDLFIQVCHAIQHAHQKGIIHRDIKPSNILVTINDGVPVPKVIDFGIAKATEQRLTDKTLFTAFEQFIGTPAYMSPEQAEMTSLDIDTRSDIYALGVLLYELLTGQTPFNAKELIAAGVEGMRQIIREKEPVRPSTCISTLDGADQTTVAKRRQSDPLKLIHQVHGDLDWIVMKCLEKDRQRRYETANALALDLDRHLHHQPVTAAAPTLGYRLTKFARRNRAALATAVAFALVLVAGVVVSVRQAVLATRARGLAEKRELEAREYLHAAYLSAARATRASIRPGRRFAALEAAAKAAAIRPSLEARNEAASALAQVDVRTAFEWQGVPPGTTILALDRNFERYARSDSRGNVSVRHVKDDRELLALAGRGGPVLTVLCFSPDGRFLAGTDYERTPRHLRVWSLDTGRTVLDEPVRVAGRALDFHPAPPTLACGDDMGTIRFFDLASGRRWSWPTNVITPQGLRFRPDGRQVALSFLAKAEVRVYEAESELLIATLEHPHCVSAMDWSPDGRWLAAPCDNANIYLWDMSRGGQLDRVLEMHQGSVRSVRFDAQGEFIISQSWDDTAMLWSMASRLPLLKLKLPECVVQLSFNSDGTRLGPFVKGQTASLLEVNRGPECRVLRATTGAMEFNSAFSPDGHWLLSGGTPGLQCWDARNGQPLWTDATVSARWIVFRPDGRELLTIENGIGARTWPFLQETESGAPRLGTPRRLPLTPPLTQADYSRDGSALVISQEQGLWVSHRLRSEPVLLDMFNCNYATVSPDGRWGAAASWGNGELRVWELPSGREALRLTNSAYFALKFTPDGRWLVLTELNSYQCLETGTWRRVGQSPRERGLASLVISADSQRVCLETETHQLQFCELPTFRPYLALDTGPESPVCWSPDGRLLVSRRSSGPLCVWDLERVRRELAAIELGW